MEIDPPISTTPVLLVVAGGQSATSSPVVPLEYISGPVEFCAVLAKDVGCHFEDGMASVAKASITISYGNVTVSDLTVGGTLFRILHGLRKQVEDPKSFVDMLKIQVSFEGHDKGKTSFGHAGPPFTKQGLQLSQDLDKAISSRVAHRMGMSPTLVMTLSQDITKFINSVIPIDVGMEDADVLDAVVDEMEDANVLDGAVDKPMTSITPVLIVVKDSQDKIQCRLVPIEMINTSVGMAATLVSRFDCHLPQGWASIDGNIVMLQGGGQKPILHFLADNGLYDAIQGRGTTSSDPEDFSTMLKLFIDLPTYNNSQEEELEFFHNFATTAEGDQLLEEVDDTLSNQPQYSLSVSETLLNDIRCGNLIEEFILELAPGYVTVHKVKTDELVEVKAKLRRANTELNIWRSGPDSAAAMRKLLVEEHTAEMKEMHQRVNAHAAAEESFKVEIEDAELERDEIGMKYDNLVDGHNDLKVKYDNLTDRHNDLTRRFEAAVDEAAVSKAHIVHLESIMQDVQAGTSSSITLPFRAY